MPFLGCNFSALETPCLLSRKMVVTQVFKRLQLWKWLTDPLILVLEVGKNQWGEGGFNRCYSLLRVCELGMKSRVAV